MNINFKNYKIYLIIFILVIIALVITIVRTRQKNQPNLEITSTPAQIEVVIDNQEYHTPLKIKLDVGKTYTVWGFATGYQAYKQNYTVQKGQNNINITLQPETQPLPPEGAPVQ